MSLKKKIVIFCVFVLLTAVGGAAMFCLNPPNPETLMVEDLQLDHANKCIK